VFYLRQVPSNISAISTLRCATLRTFRVDLAF